MSKISYNRLWHLLIDRNMSKKDLRVQTGVSTAVVAKLGRGANLTTDILIKICDALQCDLSDIMELEREQTHSAKRDGENNS